uniref:Uncharacterized protein n=1 Tax=Arundo donax TaxID=35708 RepID=A0A0A9DM32_ARUDO
MFIPHWRSVLTSRLSVKVYPSYASKAQHKPNIRQFHSAACGSRNRSKDERSSPFLNNYLGLLGRVPGLQSNHHPRRLYGTAALTLLKVLKRA